MRSEVTVRFADKDDWDEAIALVWRTFLKFEAPGYSRLGVEQFERFLFDGVIYRDFLKGDYQMIVAVMDGKVIGVASFRNQNHLSLLFVDEEYQRCGIGTELLETVCSYIKEEEGLEIITLTAAPVAVDFYKKLGFEEQGGLFFVSGITVLRMNKHL